MKQPVCRAFIQLSWMGRIQDGFGKIGVSCVAKTQLMADKMQVSPISAIKAGPFDATHEAFYFYSMQWTNIYFRNIEQNSLIADSRSLMEFQN